MSSQYSIFKNMLSCNNKFKLVQALKRGESVRFLAKKFEVCESNLYAIQNKHGLGNSLQPTRIEEALYGWLLDEKKNKNVVTTLMLFARAQEIIEELGVTTSLSTTKKWMSNFKRFYGIKTYKVSRQRLTRGLRTRESSYAPAQIYRVDETVLYWKVLPTKITQFSSPAIKSHDERLTILTCTNVCGTHKLKPMVIGCVANPGLLKNRGSAVIYQYSEDSLLTVDIFQNWFTKSFLVEVEGSLFEMGLPKKALLLLGCSIKCDIPVERLVSSDGNILTMLLPPLIPGELSIMDLFRVQYKKILLCDVIAGRFKCFILREAIVNLCLAWAIMSPNAIERCWRKIMIDDERFSVEDYSPLIDLKAELEAWKNTNMDIRSLVNYLPGGSDIESTELNAWISFDVGLSMIVDAFEIEAPAQTVFHVKALECLDTLMDWAEQNSAEEDSKFTQLFDVKNLTLSIKKKLGNLESDESSPSRVLTNN